MYELIPVTGDTYYIDAGKCSIPLYMLDKCNAVMIDSGMSKLHRNGLLELFNKTGIKVRAILTSHAHIDHTGNHSVIRELFGAKVYMSLYNAAVSQNILGLKSYFYGMSPKEIQSITSSMACCVDNIILPDQQYVEACGAKFQILHLNGHSPEHIGFVTPDNVAYLADLFVGFDAIDDIKVPYSVSCQIDFECKEKSLKYDYAWYILAHYGAYKDIEAIYKRNLILWNDRLNRLVKMAESELFYDKYLTIALKEFGVCTNNLFNITATERSIRSMLQYLVDKGRLKYAFKNGVQFFEQK